MTTIIAIYQKFVNIVSNERRTDKLYDDYVYTS